MDLRKVGFEVVDLVQLVHERVQRRGFMNSLMNLGGAIKGEIS
jgi:hypothetical protein